MFGEDIDLLLRIAAMFPMAYTPQASAIWHLDAGNRMCIKEAVEVKLHQPGSLLPSLRVVESLDRIPIETRYKARNYVAAREQKAIVDTLLQGHRQHAADLYDRWQQEYGKRWIAAALILSAPSLALKVVGRCADFLRRAQSMAQYAVEQLASRKVFGPSL